jgi:dTDP-4-dehydrorhamnose 3,5-epimerase
VKFTEIPLAGAWLIELERYEDERGHFARTFCEEEFERRGLKVHWPQMNLSHNKKKGTLRGMHWQAEPHAEAKVVRCVRGSIFDVIVDLRPKSPTLHQWHGAELSAENGAALYVPEGFAHGFQSLEADSDVFYLMSANVEYASARGIRWNDPQLAIRWPLADPIVSPKDRLLPALKET